MSNIIISRSRQEVILDLPGLTSVGEEFDLAGKRFKPGTIGKVVQVLGQSGGFTRVRMNVLSGTVLPRTRTEVINQPNQEVEEYDRDEELVEVESMEETPAGGSSWIGMDNDPRPRSGKNNKVVEQPPGSYSSQNIDIPMGGEDGGAVIIVKGHGSPSSPGQENPNEPSSLSVSEPRTGLGTIVQPTNPSEAVSMFVSTVSGRASRGQAEGGYSQKEHAEAAGKIIDDAVIVPGGRRLRSRK